MKMTHRARRSAIALVAVVAIGGSGVAVGAAAAAPAPAPTPITTGASATSVPAAAGGDARASYADVVRRVLPSVVLISTDEGLGSGVVLDHSGDIVTNAHVAGNASTFKVQVPGDPTPRSASLGGALVTTAGDIIRAAGGTPTPDTQALAGVPAAAHPGDRITLSVARAAQDLTMTVTLGELPAS
jgi:S1-C subfamily serine protease